MTVPKVSSDRSRASPLPLRRKTAALERHLDAIPGAVAQPMASGRSLEPAVALYKVMGKLFAILSLRGAENVIVKCDPHLAQMLREKYAGVGHRSHLDKRFWISVDLDADVPAKEVRRLVEHSYQLVRAKLTRKQQAELATLEKTRATPRRAVR